MQLRLEALRERRRGVRLAVDDEQGSLCGVGGPHPSHELIGICVRGKAEERDDFGADRDVGAVHAQRAGAIDERAAARARRLESGEHDEVLLAGAEPLQMVEDAAAGEHAAGGDDDARPGHPVELLGLVDAAVEVYVLREEALPLRLGERGIEILRADAAAIHLRHLDGHRAIDVHGDLGDLARLHELAEHQRDELHARDGERRDEDRAAARERVAERRAYLVDQRRRIVRAVAVCRFDHECVARRQRLGVVVQRHVVAADIAAEDDRRVAAADADAHLRERRAEDVAGVQQPHVDAAAQVERLVVVDGAEAAHGAPDVIGRVQRQRRVVLAEALAVGVLGVLFLELRGVEQDDLREVARGRRAVDGAVEALADEAGQGAAVVEVGVREDDVADRPRVEAGAPPVQQAQLFEALKHPGIDEHVPLAGAEEVARAGDRAGGALERELEVHRGAPVSASGAAEGAETDGPGEMVGATGFEPATS